MKLIHRHRYAAFCLVFPILGIELTLKWNSVTGVYGVRSIGQLIPFVTGLAGLVQVVYGIARYVRTMEPRAVMADGRANSQVENVGSSGQTSP